MNWTTKHKNLMTASNSFRSGENKDEQDLPVKQKTNASEHCNTADIMSKVVGLEEQAWKHRSDSKPTTARCQQTSVWNSRTKGLQAVGSKRRQCSASWGGNHQTESSKTSNRRHLENKATVHRAQRPQVKKVANSRRRQYEAICRVFWIPCQPMWLICPFCLSGSKEQVSKMI